MVRRAISGCATLALATSCVPHHEVATVAARANAPVDAPTLLHRLALDVPEDLRAGDLRNRNLRSPDLRGHAELAAPADPPHFAAPSFSIGNVAVDDAGRARDCLTAAVYYEARSEPADGQRAVAQVVLNRVRDRAFPNSVCGVVYQGSTRRTGCQFSFTCDGSMDRSREPAAWDRARVVASAALEGLVYAPVGSATYYHAYSVLPWWAASLSRIGSIGAHIFYRWRDGMERALAFRQAYAGHEPVVGRGAEGGGAPDATVAGVAIHYGGEATVVATSGVTVHHGVAAAGAAAGAATGAVARTLSVSGVRIHFGRALDHGDTPKDAEQAIVSQESGPI